MDCNRSNDETECPHLRLIQSKHPQPGIKNVKKCYWFHRKKKFFFKSFYYINLTWSWFSNGSLLEYSGNKEFKKFSFFSRIFLLLKETFISWLIMETGFCRLSLFLTTSNLKKTENKIFNWVNDIRFTRIFFVLKPKP